MTNAAPARTDTSHRGRLGPRRAKTVVAILAFTGILSALMQTIIVPLVADLPELLDTTPTNASWVITATLLTSAVVTPISGRLGDMYGKRRVIVACISLLIVGSVICALSSSLLPVVVGRALQGTAASTIPLGISILRDELPPRQVVGAMALISATLGVGGSIGLPISALVAQEYDWHLLFWGAGGIAVVALILVLVVVPESPVRDPGRFDVVGTIGLAAGLVCVLLAVTKGSLWGWTRPTIVILAMAGLTTLIAWVWFETRVEHPVVDVRTTASRPVLLTNLASIMAGFAMYSALLILPQLLQAPPSTGYGLGESMFAAGLCMAPSGLVMMLLSPVAARISTRFGPKVTLISGLGTIAASYVFAIVTMAATWQLVLVSAINGAGVGLAFAAMPSLIMRAVPLHQTGAANGVNALMRSFGTSSASAVQALVLTSLTVTVGTAVYPSREAFQWSFAIGIVAAAVGVLLAAFIPTRRREQRSTADQQPIVSHAAPPAGLAPGRVG